MPAFLVHIPKTAGTSLRKALEQYLQPERVEYDYGSESRETTPRVLQHVYTEGDLHAFRESMEADAIRLLAGHVPTGKYLPIFGAAECISIVREPVARLVSEFNHRVRVNGAKIQFEELYRTPEQINRQSRLLGKVAPEAMGFLGLTEQYPEAVRILNAAYGWGLRCLSLNRADPGQLGVEDLSRGTVREIRELNSRDVRLHERAQELLRQRLVLLDSGKPFVHGLVEAPGPDRIRGWAWYEFRMRNAPVELELLVNGNVEQTARAVTPREDLLVWGPPRHGCVGFEFSGVSRSARCQVRVKDTGQILGQGTGHFPEVESVLSGRFEPRDAHAKSGTLAGWVDRIDRFGVQGWAACSASTGRPLEVTFLLDGKEVGRARCDRFRPDVLEAGKHPTGVCGFDFEWTSGSVEPGLRQVEMRVDCKGRYGFSAPVVF